MATEFQHAPGPGVFEDGVVSGIAEMKKFIQHSASSALRLLPGNDGLPGDLAVQKPVIPGAYPFSLLPHQVAILKAYVCDVAPLPGQVDWAGQTVCAAGIPYEIQSSAS